jgi:hypothetical protein
MASSAVRAPAQLTHCMLHLGKLDGADVRLASRQTEMAAACEIRDGRWRGRRGVGSRRACALRSHHQSIGLLVERQKSRPGTIVLPPHGITGAVA